MQRLTLKEIQQEEFELLKAFDQFCKKNGLKYTLSAGTLLGAVRHKGFIPWDDDIDVEMVRPEYEKMKKIYRKDKHAFGKLQLVCEEDDSSWLSYSKLVNTDIAVWREFLPAGRTAHLWLDIFPIDGFPDDGREVKRMCRKVNFWSFMLVHCYAEPGRGTTAFRKLIKLPVIFASRLYGMKNCRRKLLDVTRSCPYETCKKCGIIGINFSLPRPVYETLTEVEFEGWNFPAVAAWNTYLSVMYGDYRKMPPVEKRRNHDIIAWRKK